jgi:hypothetical protein
LRARRIARIIRKHEGKLEHEHDVALFGKIGTLVTSPWHAFDSGYRFGRHNGYGFRRAIQLGLRMRREWLEKELARVKRERVASATVEYLETRLEENFEEES